MQTAAQLNGLSAHRATLRLSPDELVFSGRGRALGRVERRLALGDIVRVEAHHAEESYNLQVWTEAASWRLHVFAPLVWRFAIEDALRTLGRPVARFRDVQVGAGRRPRLAGLPGGPMPGDSVPGDSGAPRRAAAARATPDAAAEPRRPAAVPLLDVTATLRVGETLPVRLSVETPDGARVTVRLTGQIEHIDAAPSRASGDGRSGDGRSGEGDGQAGVPVLRVHT